MKKEAGMILVKSRVGDHPTKIFFSHFLILANSKGAKIDSTLKCQSLITERKKNIAITKKNVLIVLATGGNPIK